MVKDVDEIILGFINDYMNIDKNIANLKCIKMGIYM